MKKLALFTLMLLLFAACAQRPPQVSKPEIDLTPGTRAIADSEKEMFEFVKNNLNRTAMQVAGDPAIDNSHYPAMPPEDEATWKAQDYYILNEEKFLENPDLSRLIECSATKPEVAYFVGRLQNGEYRSYLVYPDNNGEQTMMGTLNYEETLTQLEGLMSKLNCRDYKVVRIKGYEYYVFNAAGTVRVFHPLCDEMTCAQIMDRLQSKW